MSIWPLVAAVVFKLTACVAAALAVVELLTVHSDDTMMLAVVLSILATTAYLAAHQARLVSAFVVDFIRLRNLEPELERERQAAPVAAAPAAEEQETST